VQASADTRAAKASRVKSRCSDAALAIGREAVQMHGAIGFTHECDVGLYLKRAVVLSARHGNAAAHRRRITATCILGDGVIG
jgi:alkylation response protein AidB-like acyl-CoA dehydrogenase